jgi:hypothetical protein
LLPTGPRAGSGAVSAGISITTLFFNISDTPASSFPSLFAEPEWDVFAARCSVDFEPADDPFNCLWRADDVSPAERRAGFVVDDLSFATVFFFGFLAFAGSEDSLSDDDNAFFDDDFFDEDFLLADDVDSLPEEPFFFAGFFVGAGGPSDDSLSDDDDAFFNDDFPLREDVPSLSFSVGAAGVESEDSLSDESDEELDDESDNKAAFLRTASRVGFLATGFFSRTESESSDEDDDFTGFFGTGLAGSGADFRCVPSVAGETAGEKELSSELIFSVALDTQKLSVHFNFGGAVKKQLASARRGIRTFWGGQGISF